MSGWAGGKKTLQQQQRWCFFSKGLRSYLDKLVKGFKPFFFVMFQGFGCFWWGGDRPEKAPRANTKSWRLFCHCCWSDSLLISFIELLWVWLFVICDDLAENAHQTNLPEVCSYQKKMFFVQLWAGGSWDSKWSQHDHGEIPLICCFSGEEDLPFAL